MEHGVPKVESGRYRPVVGTDTYSKKTSAAIRDSIHGTRNWSREDHQEEGGIYWDTQQWRSGYENVSLVPFSCHSFQANIWHKARQF